MAIEQQEMLGIPAQLKYHGGWKKWRLEVGETTHSFLDKTQALQVSKWVGECMVRLESSSNHSLTAELKEAGLKAKRSKQDLVKAVLRLRYKAASHPCICCTGVKAGIPLYKP